MMTFLLFAISLSIVSSASLMPSREKYPQIISHRGASGYVPEHSIAAYQLAMDLKTDYIEPDLCLTKDGRFVAMHDVLLDDTTDVTEKAEFADRKCTKVVDGVKTTGYFVSDFSYSELQTLRLKQRLGNIRTTIYDGLFKIPSLDDIMSLAHDHYNSTGRMVGIYVELKHPAFFKSLGFAMEDMFLEALQLGGYATTGELAYNNLSSVLPVVIQCFDKDSLIYLKDKTSLALIQLIDVPEKFNEMAIAEISKYASGIGPDKVYLAGGSVTQVEKSQALVSYAHSLGMSIHPWTFRADSGIQPAFSGDFEAEEAYFYCCLQIDAVFSEFPDRTRQTIDGLLSGNITAKTKDVGGLPACCGV